MKVNKGLVLFLTTLVLLTVVRTWSSNHPERTDNLNSWYDTYNITLFNHELPDNIELSHTLRMPDKMAITECGEITGVCRINFNPEYEMSDRVTRLTLIHEQCHVLLFVEHEYEFDDHGPKWERCMLDKANKHAFDNLW